MKKPGIAGFFISAIDASSAPRRTRNRGQRISTANSRHARDSTLLLATASNAINATMLKLNFDFIRDIAPIAAIVRVPLVMGQRNTIRVSRLK